MINKNIFSEEDLNKLPLTHRKMDVYNTSDVRELYETSHFSNSTTHSSLYYLVHTPCKPFSNFIINGK